MDPARVSPEAIVRGDNESYESYVSRKRKRNEQFFSAIGLDEAASALKATVASGKRRPAVQRGVRRGENEKKTKAEVPRRRSSRVANIPAPDVEVVNDSGRTITTTMNITGAGTSSEMLEAAPKFYDNRINDGDDINMYDGYISEKFGSDKVFPKEEIDSILDDIKSSSRGLEAEEPYLEKWSAAKCDSEDCVAKVVPDRIYAMATAPTDHKLIIAAGDKLGHVGLWDPSLESETDGVIVFRPHSRVVSHLEFTPDSSAMMSIGYDSTVRELDVATGTFKQVFATYEDDPICDKFKGSPGFGVDDGNFFVQYGCYGVDENDIFLTTSSGNVIRYDKRSGNVVFNELLSEKKINSVSLNPDGRTFATTGLDRTINIWDIRKFKSTGTKAKSGKKSVAWIETGKSCSSAFFSASGVDLLATTMADTLTITKDFKGSGQIKPEQTIKHNNQTGRYLSTFMARWHPVKDWFVVGCMKQPRQIEVFANNGKGKYALRASMKGEYLTAVCSRNVFHPTLPVLAGGNSSGRVTVVDCR